MSKEKIGRIAGDDWMDKRPKAFAVFNATYNEDGTPSSWPTYKKWTAMGPAAYKRFDTHAEALAWAFEKAEAGK